MSKKSGHRYGDKSRYPVLDFVPASAKLILDVGCYRGAFGQTLKAKGQKEIWGIEPDEEAAFEARNRLDYVINDRFHERNPIPDAYFDLITFNDSLEHMADTAHALRLSKCKLNANGLVQICVPNMRYIDNLEHLVLQKDWRYEERGIRDRSHLRFFTRKSIQDVLNEEGYLVQKVIGINERWRNKRKWMRTAFFSLFPGFTHDMRFVQFIVIARANTSY